MPKGKSESVNRRRADNTMAKRKGTKDKQRPTKHTYKTTDRVTRTPLKIGGEHRCSGRVGRSCSTRNENKIGKGVGILWLNISAIICIYY